MLGTWWRSLQKSKKLKAWTRQIEEAVRILDHPTTHDLRNQAEKWMDAKTTDVTVFKEAFTFLCTPAALGTDEVIAKYGLTYDEAWGIFRELHRHACVSTMGHFVPLSSFFFMGTLDYLCVTFLDRTQPFVPDWPHQFTKDHAAKRLVRYFEDGELGLPHND